MNARPIIDTDIVVVGAGPVGLLTALTLSERGVRLRIIDKYRRAALHSYALALHPHTLELLDEFGLADRLIERGQPVDRLVLHHEGEAPVELDLGLVGGSFPFVLVLPQTLLEGALERRLAENGVDVWWNQLALSCETTGDTVHTLVTAVREEGSPPEVATSLLRSAFVVGADGSASLVRRILQIDYAEVGPPTTYGLVEFESTITAPNELHLVIGRESTDVLWPLGPDRGRFNLALDHGSTPHGVAGLKALAGKRFPGFAGRIGAVEWSTTMEFERRLAERFGAGLIWLAGDAAHLTSPVGVQGMNVGMREGHDLARRLTEILLESGSHDLLRYYNWDRRKEWRGLMGLKGAFDVSSRTPDWIGRMPERVLAALPVSRVELNLLLAPLGLQVVWARRSPAPSLHGTAPRRARPARATAPRLD